MAISRSTFAKKSGAEWSVGINDFNRLIDNVAELDPHKHALGKN